MGMQFLGSPHSVTLEESRFLMIPAPFDATASYGTGARFGPERIIEASKQLELFDEELLIEPWKAGICTASRVDLPVVAEKAVDMIASAAGSAFHSGKIPVLLGGDHSVTIGAIKAAHECFGPLDILQFDAHADLREEYQGTRYSHACVMRRVWGLGNVIQVGIRSFSKKEWEFIKAQDKIPLLAKDVIADIDKATDATLSRLSGRPLYITIDVDCLDPSMMPATGTPEPGGLLWHHLLTVLSAVVERSQVIGFDVVELAPVPGLHYPEYTIARLVYRLVGLVSIARGFIKEGG